MRERSAEKSLTNAIIRSNPLIGVERGLRTATTLEGSMEKRALKKAPRKCAVFSLPANPRRPNRGSCARHTDRSEGAPESVTDGRDAWQRRRGAGVPPCWDYICRTHRSRIRTH
jgi:hypothetical protein